MEFTEEQILLRALSRGDEKAFEVLFMRYFPVLYPVCFRMI